MLQDKEKNKTKIYCAHCFKRNCKATEGPIPLRGNKALKKTKFIREKRPHSHMLD